MADWEKHFTSKTFDSGTATAPLLPNNDLVVGGKKWPLFEHGRCTHNHPALPMPNSTRVIYGGACDHPKQTDCDIYVGLTGYYEGSYPWQRHGAIRVSYAITDMAAPKDAKSFKDMIVWLKEALDQGMKVHVGCVGGHGRTGTVLAALVAAYGEKDAISYVRKHYCEKAVETHEQVDFLVKHFGVTPVGGAKERKRGQWWDEGDTPLSLTPRDAMLPKLPKKKERFEPMPNANSIFGSRSDDR